jgi:hypothetical protein
MWTSLISVASNWTAHQILLRRSESQKEISLIRQVPGRTGVLSGALALSRAGFEGLTREVIGAQIRSKVDASYIYSLARAIGGETLKFNVIVEGDRGARTECALEYLPGDKTLRLITFY